MEHNELLSTKLSPPYLHSALVERKHLLDRLDAGLARSLTLISAPAGFGKTTLLTEWMASARTAIPLPAISDTIFVNSCRSYCRSTARNCRVPLTKPVNMPMVSMVVRSFNHCKSSSGRPDLSLSLTSQAISPLRRSSTGDLRRSEIAVCGVLCEQRKGCH